jgi:hypothetical protein
MSAGEGSPHGGTPAAIERGMVEFDNLSIALARQTQASTGGGIARQATQATQAKQAQSYVAPALPAQVPSPVPAVVIADRYDVEKVGQGRMLLAGAVDLSLVPRVAGLPPPEPVEVIAPAPAVTVRPEIVELAPIAPAVVIGMHAAPQVFATSLLPEPVEAPPPPPPAPEGPAPRMANAPAPSPTPAPAPEAPPPEKTWEELRAELEKKLREEIEKKKKELKEKRRQIRRERARRQRLPRREWAREERERIDRERQRLEEQNERENFTREEQRYKDFEKNWEDQRRDLNRELDEAKRSGNDAEANRIRESLSELNRNAWKTLGEKGRFESRSVKWRADREALQNRERAYRGTVERHAGEIMDPAERAHQEASRRTGALTSELDDVNAERERLKNTDPKTPDDRARERELERRFRRLSNELDAATEDLRRANDAVGGRGFDYWSRLSDADLIERERATSEALRDIDKAEKALGKEGKDVRSSHDDPIGDFRKRWPDGSEDELDRRQGWLRDFEDGLRQHRIQRERAQWDLERKQMRLRELANQPSALDEANRLKAEIANLEHRIGQLAAQEAALGDTLSLESRKLTKDMQRFEQDAYVTDVRYTAQQIASRVTDFNFLAPPHRQQAPTEPELRALRAIAFPIDGGPGEVGRDPGDGTRTKDADLRWKRFLENGAGYPADWYGGQDQIDKARRLLDLRRARYALDIELYGDPSNPRDIGLMNDPFAKPEDVRAATERLRELDEEIDRAERDLDESKAKAPAGEDGRPQQVVRVDELVREIDEKMARWNQLVGDGQRPLYGRDLEEAKALHRELTQLEEERKIAAGLYRETDAPQPLPTTSDAPKVDVAPEMREKIRDYFGAKDELARLGATPDAELTDAQRARRAELERKVAGLGPVVEPEIRRIEDELAPPGGDGSRTRERGIRPGWRPPPSVDPRTRAEIEEFMRIDERLHGRWVNGERRGGLIHDGDLTTAEAAEMADLQRRYLEMRDRVIAKVGELGGTKTIVAEGAGFVIPETAEQMRSLLSGNPAISNVEIVQNGPYHWVVRFTLDGREHVVESDGTFRRTDANGVTHTHHAGGGYSRETGGTVTTTIGKDGDVRVGDRRFTLGEGQTAIPDEDGSRVAIFGKNGRGETELSGWESFDGSASVRFGKNTEGRATVTINGRTQVLEEGETVGTIAGQPDVVAIGRTVGGAFQLGGWIDASNVRHEIVPGASEAVFVKPEGERGRLLLDPAKVLETKRIDVSPDYLEPDTARVFERVLENLPMLNGPFAAAIRGQGEWVEEGGVSYRVKAVYVRQGRLHIDVESNQGEGTSTQMRSYVVEHLQSGGVKVFSMWSGGAARWEFDPSFAHVKSAIHNGEGFVDTGSGERRGAIWAFTPKPISAGTSSIAFETFKTTWKSAMGYLEKGAEIIFSPLQTIHYSIQAMIQELNGHGIPINLLQLLYLKDYDEGTKGLSRASAVYTARQAKFLDWGGVGLSTDQEKLDALRVVRSRLTGAQYEVFRNAVIGQYNQIVEQASRGKGGDADFDRITGTSAPKDPSELDLARMAATVMGFANAPRMFMSEGRENWRNGNTAEAVKDYLRAGGIIAGSAYVESFGLGALNALKTATVAKATGLTAAQVQRLSTVAKTAKGLTEAEKTALRLSKILNGAEMAAFLTPMASNIVSAGIDLATGKTDAERTAAFDKLFEAGAGLLGFHMGSKTQRAAREAQLREQVLRELDRIDRRLSPAEDGLGLRPMDPALWRAMEEAARKNGVGVREGELPEGAGAGYLRRGGGRPGEIIVREGVEVPSELEAIHEHYHLYRDFRRGFSREKLDRAEWLAEEVRAHEWSANIGRSRGWPKEWIDISLDNARIYRGKLRGELRRLGLDPAEFSEANPDLHGRYFDRPSGQKDVVTDPRTTGGPGEARVSPIDLRQAPEARTPNVNVGALEYLANRIRRGQALDTAEVGLLLDGVVDAAREHFIRRQGLDPTSRDGVRQGLGLDRLDAGQRGLIESTYHALRAVGIREGDIQVRTADVPGRGKHTFLEVRMSDGRTYLVDPTFARFFGDLRESKHLPIERAALVELMKNGRIELDPQLGDAIGRLIGDATPDGIGHTRAEVEGSVPMSVPRDLVEPNRTPTGGIRADQVGRIRDRLGSFVQDLWQSVTMRLPGYKERQNEAFGRRWIESVAELQDRIETGTIRTFGEAMSFLAGERRRIQVELNAERRRAGAEDTALDPPEQFGKDRPLNLMRPDITKIEGRYGGYEGAARRFLGGEDARQIVHDGIPLTTVRRGASGGRVKYWWEHMPPTEIHRLLPLIDGALQRALGAKTRTELIDAVAELHYFAAHMMPWRRGSAAAIDAVAKALLLHGGVRPGRLKEGVAFDLEAFTRTLEDYKRRYRSFFE